MQAFIRTTIKERRSLLRSAQFSVAIWSDTGETQRRSFVQRSYSLGSDQNFRWDKALQVAAAIEDEELSRKFSLRK